MELRIISVQTMQMQDGTMLYKVYCALNDGAVGFIYSKKPAKPGDFIKVAIGCDKNGRLSVRVASNS